MFADSDHRLHLPTDYLLNEINERQSMDASKHIYQHVFIDIAEDINVFAIMIMVKQEKKSKLA